MFGINELKNNKFIIRTQNKEVTGIDISEITNFINVSIDFVFKFEIVEI